MHIVAYPLPVGKRIQPFRHPSDTQAIITAIACVADAAGYTHDGIVA